MIKHRTLRLVISSLVLITTTSYSKNEGYIKYCQQAGGVVEVMTAEFNTASGYVEGQSKRFCNFLVNDGFLVIGLETFASKKPSIAATLIKKLNYIADDSLLWRGNYSNPSHNVCKNLGGSGIGFVASGGFTDRIGESDICVFGDGSMVSGWSLIYMANHRKGYDDIKNKIQAQPLPIDIPQ